MKLEPVNAKIRNNKYEFELYELLEGVPGIPLVYYYGRAGNFLTGKWNVLVMELLGPNLGNLMKSCGGRFTLKTTLMIADQVLLLLEHIHDKGFINRDIKLDNLMMGAGRNMHTAYIIDFGLAKKVLRSNGDHIEYRENVSLIGTAMYMSIHAHRGVEQSRRDDMESLGYVFLHMMNGRLPWVGFNAEVNRARYDALGRQKENMSLEDLCSGVPREFLDYFKHVRGLGFKDRPDYTALRRAFQKRMKKEGLEDDGRYDWSKHPAPRPRSAQYKRGKTRGKSASKSR